MIKKLSFLILAATIIFNLWLNFPETQILADPNDNIFQYSLVGRTNWVWQNYGCPLSLECLPNLVDHNVPNWAEGYPLPFYYSHVPQIVIVTSYHLLIKPIASILNSQFSIFNYYNWTKYLLLTFFPLSVFLALRIVGFSPVLAAFGAFFSAHFSTDGLYGIDPPSYLWRGYGLTSQLYAIFFLPLGIAFTYKALRHLGGDRMGSPEVEEAEKDFFQIHLPGVHSATCKVKYLILAILFLTLTTAGHLGIGIIGLLSTIPFLFFDLKPQNIFRRTKILFLVLSSSFIVLSYWLIPILLNNQYHIISFWDPVWKFDSYGWYEMVKQFFSGEIFDWQRLPIITGLVISGFFVNLIRTNNNSPPSTSYFKRGLGGVNLSPFSFLFIFWILFYFGRTTWGGLIDLIPGMKDFHQHRFIVGVHVAALFLIPAGLEYISSLFRVILSKAKDLVPTPLRDVKYASPDSSPAKRDQNDKKRNVQDPRINIHYNIIFYIVIFIFISLLIYFTAKQTIAYAQLNNRWIKEANEAYLYDEKNFQNLLSYIDRQPKARIYAGRPGNWGKDFRLGSTQLYLLLGGIGYDISQFLPETWSPLSENEQNFDEREALDYDLLNIRYIVSSKNQGFAPAVKLANKYGPFELYQAPTTGWFDVVTSPMFVKSDKTNYINLVHLWWNSHPRRWKMHPLISVEKHPIIPDGVQRRIIMTNEVSYLEETDRQTRFVQSDKPGLKEKNIFSDYPFVFPEATVSAYLKEGDKDTSGVTRIADSDQDTPGVAGIQGFPRGEGTEKNVAIISNEKITKQTYSAAVDVPNNCRQCMIMFKMSYHPDWIAKLEGKEVKKFAVFPFYLAVQANPGTHTVEFTYKPNRLKIIILSVGFCLLLILIILRKKLKNQSV